MALVSVVTLKPAICASTSMFCWHLTDPSSSLSICSSNWRRSSRIRSNVDSCSFFACWAARALSDWLLARESKPSCFACSFFKRWLWSRRTWKSNKLSCSGFICTHDLHALRKVDLVRWFGFLRDAWRLRGSTTRYLESHLKEIDVILQSNRVCCSPSTCWTSSLSTDLKSGSWTCLSSSLAAISRILSPEITIFYASRVRKWDSDSRSSSDDSSTVSRRLKRDAAILKKGWK